MWIVDGEQSGSRRETVGSCAECAGCCTQPEVLLQDLPAAAVRKDRQDNAAMNNNQNQDVNNLVKPSSRFGCAGTVSATEKQKSTELRNASLMT